MIADQTFYNKVLQGISY